MAESGFVPCTRCLSPALHRVAPLSCRSEEPGARGDDTRHVSLHDHHPRALHLRRGRAAAPHGGLRRATHLPPKAAHAAVDCGTKGRPRERQF